MTKGGGLAVIVAAAIQWKSYIMVVNILTMVFRAVERYKSRKKNRCPQQNNMCVWGAGSGYYSSNLCHLYVCSASDGSYVFVGDMWLFRCGMLLPATLLTPARRTQKEGPTIHETLRFLFLNLFELLLMQ